MRKYLPFALLIPALLLLGMFVAAQLGFALHWGNPSSALFGAAAWVLLFLIVYGHTHHWSSVRAFLIIFVVGKFAAIFYYQAVHAARLDQVLVRLAGATILAWFMFGFFWPRRAKDEKSA